MMPTKKECVCCCSIGEVVAKMEEIGAVCITECDGFDAVCLNLWVLQTAYYQYSTDCNMASTKNPFMSTFNRASGLCIGPLAVQSYFY